MVVDGLSTNQAAANGSISRPNTMRENSQQAPSTDFFRGGLTSPRVTMYCSWCSGLWHQHGMRGEN